MSTIELMVVSGLESSLVSWAMDFYIVVKLVYRIPCLGRDWEVPMSVIQSIMRWMSSFMLS